MQNDLLTIEQTAQLLNVSKDTIRRRIKAGEIKAEKHLGPYGEQWLISENQFSQAYTVNEVVPVTRSISVGELQQSMQIAIADAVTQIIRAETQELTDKITHLEDELANKITHIETELEAKVAQLESQLAVSQQLIEQQSKMIDENFQKLLLEKPEKSFWQKLFG